MKKLDFSAEDTNTPANESAFQKFISAVLTYIALLIFHGYIFGYSDQIEMIPLVWAMGHPEAYSSDFFIQHIIHKPIHERWFFIQFLFRFGLSHPISIFLLHAISSLSLILGLYAIAKKYLRLNWLRWATIITTLIFTYHINLGGNELYYNLLIPSLPAKAFGAWAIYFALSYRWARSMTFASLACLIQPLVGIQLWLLILLSGVSYSIFQGKRYFKQKLFSAGIFVLIAGPWLWLLFSQHNQGELDVAHLFEIIEFRLSHHFFPSWFSIKGYVLISLLSIVGIYFYSKKDWFFSWFIIWILIGSFIYTIGVELIKMPLILNTQWFKATIWLKFAGIVACFGVLEHIIGNRFNVHKLPSIGLLLLACVTLLIVKFSGLMIQNRPYDFPWVNDLNQEQNISMLAQEMSQPDDLFILPPDFTAFKWFSKRNSYVDFKAMIHHKDVLEVWYTRIQNIYGYNLTKKLVGQSMDESYQQYWKELAKEDWEEFAQKGVKYLIAPKKLTLPLERVKANDSYVIYVLK